MSTLTLIYGIGCAVILILLLDLIIQIHTGRD
jgi:hypothetical protein